MSPPDDDFFSMSLFDMFKADVASQVATLTDGLLAAERDEGGIERLMRAAHSIKGAARIIGVEPVVKVAHAMEDCFVAAQRELATLGGAEVDVLLRACDELAAVSTASEVEVAAWEARRGAEVAALLADLGALASGRGVPGGTPRTPRGGAGAGGVAGAAGKRPGPPPGPSSATTSLFALFRAEVESRTAAIADAIDGLAADPSPGQRLDALIGAVNAILDASRTVDLEPARRLSDAMEQALQGAHERRNLIDPAFIALLNDANLALRRLARVDLDELDGVLGAETAAFERIATQLDEVRRRPRPMLTPVATVGGGHALAARPATAPAPTSTTAIVESDASRFVRVGTANINRLLGLAGEALVATHALSNFVVALDRLRTQQTALVEELDRTQAAIRELGDAGGTAASCAHDARTAAIEARRAIVACRGDLEVFAQRSEELGTRLYREAVATRMRPFSDGIGGFPRLVRDLARKFAKQVELVVEGEDVRVDRDILDRIEAPLNHMLRNAVDHGIETPAVRAAAGKPERGVIRLEARHSAGVLSLSVSDDGQGLHLEKIRQRAVQRGLIDARGGAALTDTEAVEYIFVSGFSTADAVTEVSGRGVGLDVVRSTVQEIGGSVRTYTEAGRGCSFHLRLPLTLSVTRAVVVEIAGEPYAFPLLRIDRLVKLQAKDLRVLENRQYFELDGRNVGVIQARQVLELDHDEPYGAELCVVVISDRATQCGIAVDRFLGEQDLVVQPLDPRLGRVADISAAAVTSEGEPLLIVDVEDMVRSITRMVNAGLVAAVDQVRRASRRGPKRVLVVDDSLTVREVHRQILTAGGYQVEVANDGVAGWNVIRSGEFDLIVTDVDMPRMNGFELVRSVRQDPRLRHLPIMIVSYKDRPDDRARGLEVGANYYLTKGDFHDDAFRAAVTDLVGPAR